MALLVELVALGFAILFMGLVALSGNALEPLASFLRLSPPTPVRFVSLVIGGLIAFVSCYLIGEEFAGFPKIPRDIFCFSRLLTEHCESALDKADKALAEGNFDRALKAYNDAILLQPDHTSPAFCKVSPLPEIESADTPPSPWAPNQSGSPPSTSEPTRSI